MGKSVLLVMAVLVISVQSHSTAVKGQLENLKQNPMLRYWTQSKLRLRSKLGILEALASKTSPEGAGDKYRNCFFSPVQCQLPVVITSDSLASAIIPERTEEDTYARFRRLNQI